MHASYPCFDGATLALWAAAQQTCIKAQPTAADKTPCDDCTPQYQARMVAAGRCANPTHRFREDGR